jgi:hypothetical protein
MGADMRNPGLYLTLLSTFLGVNPRYDANLAASASPAAWMSSNLILKYFQKIKDLQHTCGRCIRGRARSKVIEIH